MINPFSWLVKLWNWIAGHQLILQQIAAEAAPIVNELISLVPVDAFGNRALVDVLAAYEKYGIPAENWITSLPPNGLGPALMALVTAILRSRFASASTKILQLGIQGAVVAVDTKSPSMSV